MQQSHLVKLGALSESAYSKPLKAVAFKRSASGTHGIRPRNATGGERKERTVIEAYRTPEWLAALGF